MTSPLGVPASARTAWLTLAIAMDRPTPCRKSEQWVSEDAETRAAAAFKCGGCHAFEVCARYAQAASETVGVWAGVDRTPPVKSMGRPRKTTTKDAA